ncbi:hypothetical protein Nepgr_001810 [Nepenthes gracilis]|uniref:DUF3741 domain-containing protein n=1 Tax=Nepenthes gracilis TaxID=150966 RepID=A0AAD3P5P0_NEPGR|nr:hypothetical protein Nepgr_001810 [Nepenthes gracilis]
MLCLDRREIVQAESRNGVATSRTSSSLLQLNYNSPSVQAAMWQLAFVAELPICYRYLHGENEKSSFSQPFRDAKCLYANEKIQESKEIDDFQGALHPNKELLLKSINQPALILAKHLRDLYGAHDYHYGHV